MDTAIAVSDRLSGLGVRAGVFGPPAFNLEPSEAI